MDFEKNIICKKVTWYTMFSPFISSLKNVELSKLQINLDDVAKSLIRYSASEQHKYQSSSLTVQIRRNLEIPTVDFQTESGDEISLTSPDIGGFQLEDLSISQGINHVTY